MKILLVDDEKHVREGILLLINFEAYGIDEILEAENGQEALVIMEREKPDIMLCDMQMPYMDGVALLNEIENRKIGVQLIVISGYSDFRYTRATIMAKGIDYILKPIKKADLENAIERAIVLANGEKLANKSDVALQLKENNEVLSKSMILKWLKNEVSLQEALPLMKCFGEVPDQMFLQAMIPINAEAIIGELYKDDMDLFEFVVGNIFREIMRKYSFKILICLPQGEWVALVSGAHTNQAEFETKTKIFKQTLADLILLNILVSPRRICCSRSEAPAKLQDTLDGLMDCEIYRNQDGIANNLVRISEIEVLLRSAIQEGKREFLAQMLKAYREKLLMKKSITLRELQLITAEANLIYFQLAGELGKQRRQISEWTVDINKWFSELFLMFENLMESRLSQRPMAENIREFIKRHYNRNITLNILSDTFAVSPQYIARMYREKFGTTVINDLTAIRMEKAVDLVLHSNMSIAEIALVLGYEDESYFGKVFKRRMGESPQRYRKKNS